MSDGRPGTWFSGFLDLIFPPSCVFCDGELDSGPSTAATRWRGYGVCGGCWRSLPWIRPPYCPSCAKPIPSVQVPSHVCGDCLLEPPPFDSARALLVYEEEILPVIHRMKYGPRPSLARFFGHLMAEILGEDIRSLAVDGFVPVPLHRKRLRQRGFNQASVMARVMGRTAAIPVMLEALERTRWTLAQVGLSRAQRELNVRGAFRVGDPNRMAGGRWLLVDDVYTTGSTLREAARALWRAGAAEVHVVTLARVP
jgi:ComF family protein